MSFLRRHLFPVDATLERLVAVSFAFPVALLGPKVAIESRGTETRVTTTQPGGGLTLDLTFDDRAGDIDLPRGSPFADWRTARRFAGPMPFSFSPQADGSFVVVEGSRTRWTPRPVELKSWRVGLFDEPAFREAAPVAANAFAVNDITYHWGRGRIVWPGNQT